MKKPDRKKFTPVSDDLKQLKKDSRSIADALVETRNVLRGLIGVVNFIESKLLERDILKKEDIVEFKKAIDAEQKRVKEVIEKDKKGEPDDSGTKESEQPQTTEV